jgi:hypothetical protein
MAISVQACVAVIHSGLDIGAKISGGDHHKPEICYGTNFSLHFSALSFGRRAKFHRAKVNGARMTEIKHLALRLMPECCRALAALPPVSTVPTRPFPKNIRLGLRTSQEYGAKRSGDNPTVEELS